MLRVRLLLFALEQSAEPKSNKNSSWKSFTALALPDPQVTPWCRRLEWYLIMNYTALHGTVTRPFSINNMSETTLWEPHPETWLWVTVDPHCQIQQWPSSSSTLETALTISGLADVKQGRIWSVRTKETQQGGWFIYEWTEQKCTWLKKKVGSSTWYAFPQLNYHSLLEIIHCSC